ncbi:putative endo-rhamnogalacturonase f protein [Botrytis fragariae]|uniref:Putative endo-rhamnogalacturonase f protein n=1 Tax=Botrytis fragariae TaxID=1964551 RepID=A0A8H6AQL6_9HELO|nr:putative endo-rhamnogalacturonase f protein [Botrytis fragariae]KAF5871791.1 putative endo-rhamnogalacturonase f protein [Botrytis fragariae]
MFSIKASLLLLLHLGLFSQAQLTGPVGVTTPLSKKTTECNIRTLYPTFNPLTDDVSIPITNAFTSCVQKHAGSRLIVPAGNYTLKTSIILSNATNWAFQLDGLITATYYPNSTDSTYVVPYVVPRARILEGFAGVEKLNRYVLPRQILDDGITDVEVSNSTINGEGDGEFLENLIVIINAVDFELYSSNGLGAIQGQGYLYRISGNTNRPRMLRLISPINATIHDLLLIDSPKFHFIFDFGENIEVYHLTIRGANLGSYDGIDAIGTNYWVHDNEHARNISVLGGNEIVFIKTYPGGSGYVSNILWENFRSKASLYGINLNQYWQQTYLPDSGAVTLTNITFRNFTGSIQNGAQRPALYLLASDYIPATNITIKDVTVWTESGSTSVNHISNIFGQGDNVYGTNDGLVSLGAGENPKTKTYTSTYTITSAPTGWATPTWPSWAVPTTGYGTAVPIPVYTPAPLWKPQGDYDKHYWGTF